MAGSHTAHRHGRARRYRPADRTLCDDHPSAAVAFRAALDAAHDRPRAAADSKGPLTAGSAGAQLGCYGEVLVAGDIRVGDAVELT